MSNNSNHNTTIEKLLSACTGALITSLMVTPMDVIKMRLQTQQRTLPLKRSCCTWTPCSLTQSAKSLKIPTIRKSSLQVASIHECALPQQPMILKGTVVSGVFFLFIFLAQLILLYFERTVFTRYSSMKESRLYGRDSHLH